MLYTTYRLVLAVPACETGIDRITESIGGPDTYGLDTPIGLDFVLDSNGLNHALWALRCVLPEQQAVADRFARLFACRCAYDVLPIFERVVPGDDRPRKAIQVARRFALGLATRGDLAAARSAAYAATRSAADAADAAYAATRSAADAAYAAARSAADAAAYAAAYAADRAKQSQLFLSALRDEIELDDFPGLEDPAPVALLS